MDRKFCTLLAMSIALAGCSRPAEPEGAATAAADAAAALANDPATPSSDARAAAEATEQAPARLDGYGPLQLGDDVAQLRSAWPGTLKGADDPGQECVHLIPDGVGMPRDLAFMVEGGRFVRYDVGLPQPAAPGGGRVGMDLQELQALYPTAELQPHKYVEGGHNLRVAPAVSSDATLVFEIDADGRVTAWRAGLPPQVDYVEGCS